MAPALPAEAAARLRCCDLDGEVRYELPARHLRALGRYEAYWRDPPLVIHRAKGRTFCLDHPEFLLVGVAENHCLSVAVAPGGWPVAVYVNINQVPERGPDGFQWRDLELDLKLVRNAGGGWSAVLIDLEEFRQRQLPPDLRTLALGETARVVRGVGAGTFPGFTPASRWLGVPAEELRPWR